MGFDLLKWIEDYWKEVRGLEPEPVKEEPKADPQEKFAGTGDVVGYITGGYAHYKNGVLHWTFYDQQGNDLTSVPYTELGKYVVDNVYQVSFINGVPVWKVLVKK